MKKSLFISTLILGTTIMIGCSKVEIDMPVTPSSAPTSTAHKSESNNDDKPISFNAVLHTKQTKAAENPELSDGIKFKTFAYYTGNFSWESISTSDMVTYIDGSVVSKTNGIWAPAEVYNWPKAGSLTFLGYAPENAKLSITNDKENIIKADKYTNDGTDVMVADVVKNLNVSNGETGVPMTFHHILSQVKFNVKAKMLHDSSSLDFDITVKEVTLNDVYRTGDFSWKSNNTASWSNPRNPDESGLVIYNGNGISLSEANTVLDAGRIVLPQNLDHVTIAVKFVLTTKQNGTVLDSTEVKETISLNSPRIPQWSAGGSYSYDIIVNPLSGASISFDPIVSEWTNASSTVSASK